MSSGAGTGGTRGGGGVLALDRHHRQPRLHARAAGGLEQAGGTVVFLSPVLGGEVTGEGIVIRVGGSEPMELCCTTLINSAGLLAPQLARTMAAFPSRASRAVFRQGSLLHDGRAARHSAAGLSDAGAAF